MKKLFSVCAIFGFSIAQSHAVYAPIPPQEQGKALTVELKSGVYFDSNIFGDYSGEDKVDSFVIDNTATFKFNASLTDQTLFSGSYGLQYQKFDDRPTNDDMFNHTLMGMLSHTFAENRVLTLTEIYADTDNPASTLSTGTTKQSDQSSKNNTLIADYLHQITERYSVGLNYQNKIDRYDEASLATDLDAVTNEFSVTGFYKYLPQWDIVGMFRYRDTNYDDDTTAKDNETNFFLVGANYRATEKLTYEARAGLEQRDRSGSNSNNDTFYSSLNATYAYGERSFALGSVTFEQRDSSSVSDFLDSENLIFTGTVQHGITSQVWLTADVSYDIASLNRRPGTTNFNLGELDEETFTMGLALTYEPTSQWSIIGSYDYDNKSNDATDSGDVSRRSQRNRLGVYARYTF